MRKRYYASFFLFFSLFKLSASNDTLTIGQAFNWQVGDTFIYAPYTWMQVTVGPGGQKGDVYSRGYQGFTVKSKLDLSDSILYSVQYFDSSISSLLFTSLDSPVHNFRYLYQFKAFAFCIDSLPSCYSSWAGCWSDTYPDSTFNNYLTTSQLYNMFEAGASFVATAHVGLRSAGIGALEYYPGTPMGIPGGCGADLIYYRSGSFTWIDSALYFYTGIAEEVADSRTLRIYPNPANNVLFVENLTPNSNKIQVIKIYDLQSRLLKEINLVRNNNRYEVDISNLPAGAYLISIEDKISGSSFRTKLIKQ